MVVGTGVLVPCAQFGTQFCKSLVPSPTVCVLVHEDHVMSVTTFPPSPLKSISDGSVPANVAVPGPVTISFAAPAAGRLLDSGGVDDGVCSIHPAEISPSQASLPFTWPPSSSTLAVTVPSVLASEQIGVSSNGTPSDGWPNGWNPGEPTTTTSMWSAEVGHRMALKVARATSHVRVPSAAEYHRHR